MILTHFSQRYPKIPVINDGTALSERCVVFAFDLMTITMDNICEFAKLVPNLHLLFPVDDVDDDHVTIGSEGEQPEEGQSVPVITSNS